MKTAHEWAVDITTLPESVLTSIKEMTEIIGNIQDDAFRDGQSEGYQAGYEAARMDYEQKP